MTRGLYYCWESFGRGRVLLLGVIWQGACITARGHLAGGVYYCWGSDGRRRVLLLEVIWQGACITAGSHLAGGVYYCWGSFDRGRVLLLGVRWQGRVLLLGVIWQGACITAGWLTEANTCDVWPLIEAIVRSGSRFLLSVSHNHSPDSFSTCPQCVHPQMCIPPSLFYALPVLTFLCNSLQWPSRQCYSHATVFPL